MTIDEFISKLTSKEYKQHAKLIEECRIRELNIRLAILKSETALKNTPDLDEALSNLMAKAEDLRLEMANLSFNIWCERKK